MMTSTEGRRRAREAAFQVAFQADLMGESFLETWSRLKENLRLSADQQQLVDDVVGTLELQHDAVDEALRAAAENWEIERLAATDRSVLRASVAELLGRPGTPVRVVLNEAIEIAKRYGSEESGRFVNGVLDRVARSLRPQEM
jgi:N utilization substance protein B